MGDQGNVLAASCWAVLSPSAVIKTKTLSFKTKTIPFKTKTKTNRLVFERLETKTKASSATVLLWYHIKFAYEGKISVDQRKE